MLGVLTSLQDFTGSSVLYQLMSLDTLDGENSSSETSGKCCCYYMCIVNNSFSPPLTAPRTKRAVLCSTATPLPNRCAAEM